MFLYIRLYKIVWNFTNLAEECEKHWKKSSFPEKQLGSQVRESHGLPCTTRFRDDTLSRLSFPSPLACSSFLTEHLKQQQLILWQAIVRYYVTSQQHKTMVCSESRTSKLRNRVGEGRVERGRAATFLPAVANHDLPWQVNQECVAEQRTWQILRHGEDLHAVGHFCLPIRTWGTTTGSCCYSELLGWVVNKKQKTNSLRLQV